MREHLLRPSRSIGSIEIPFSNVASSCAEQDDVQLVAASKRGDQDAFSLLVQRHQRRIFNLNFRML